MARKKSSPNTPQKEDSTIKKVNKGADAKSKRSSGKSRNRAKLQPGPTTAKEGKGIAEDRPQNKSFPIVGIGASAGGLEAFIHLLEHLPGNTDMAFVVVQHLDPKHESMLPDLLSRAAKMPVTQVEDGMRVEPNHIYVIPSNTNMGISQGVLSLITRPKTSAPHIPIDNFLRSLALDQKDKSIGVILSGTGSDGAIGIETIKAEGGITFAQDESSAKYSGMPRSAIATGCVDFILPPEEIAKELVRIGSHPYVTRPAEVQHIMPLPAESEDDFSKIFTFLRTGTGVDFSHYKRTTIRRRIMRRMALHRIEKLRDYVDYLKNNPSEIEALHQDILIKVTGFFREPETFEFLKKKIFPEIVKNKSSEESIRIWVPGCSTGEEVYSIAICLLEFLGNMAGSTSIQIFATDISDVAINKARAGVYIENIGADVSTERLRRFFVKTDLGFQVIKSVRDVCIFAKQNLIKDPPFSNLDLISCRNVLIYLGPDLQRKLMPTFHYALKPSGFLILGNAETIGTFSDLFTPADKKHKIYSKRMTSARMIFNFVKGNPVEKEAVKRMNEEVGSGLDMYKKADHIILSKYTPPGVLINQDMEVLQFRGHTSPYLEPAPGRASLNLLKMVREGLLSDVRSAVQKAKRSGASVKREGLKVKHDGKFRDFSINVIPITDSSAREHHFLVLFEDATRSVDLKPKKTIKKVESDEITELKQELEATREYLQSVIQEQEAANEELKSANEEIQSSNEELQSINEELETAKEELQSTNEELTTVNEELQNRNFELSQANNDLNNLIVSVNIPIIMVENDLRIRRFTPMAEKVLNLVPQDIGRSISDIRLNISVSDLDKLISDAIDTISIKEQEVQTRGGHWYHMQIRPYRTSENKIDGAVMTFFDIDLIKRSLEQIKESRDYAETIVETVRHPLIVLDADKQIKTVNRAFCEVFKISKEETEGRSIYELGNGQWNVPQLRVLLNDALTKNKQFQDLEISREFERIGHRTMALNSRQIYDESRDTNLILLAIEDITERKRTEEIIRREILLKEIHHRVKNNLQIISGLLNLQSGHVQDKETVEIFKECQNRIRSMALIHEQLYQSKDLRRIDFNEYVQNLVDYLFRSYGVDLNTVTLKISGNYTLLNIDAAVPCGLIINELVSNSLKYAFPDGKKGEIYVDISSDGDNTYTLTIGDNGIGLPEDLDFRNTESLGLQLFMMLAGQIGGIIEFNRSNGTEFKITFTELKKERD